MGYAAQLQTAGRGEEVRNEALCTALGESSAARERESEAEGGAAVGG